jgi:hypothetical protein
LELEIELIENWSRVRMINFKVAKHFSSLDGKKLTPLKKLPLKITKRRKQKKARGTTELIKKQLILNSKKVI